MWNTYPVHNSQEKGKVIPTLWSSNIKKMCQVFRLGQYSKSWYISIDISLYVKL